jgi:hypothetical protein
MFLNHNIKKSLTTLVIFFIFVSLSFSYNNTHKKSPFGKNKILTDSIRPDRKFNYLSPSGHFLIHYDTTGYNAVSPIDEGHNGIPDYIDSVAFYFDLVWEVEINEIGYIEPIKDNDRGGSDSYDIYISELGDTLGGYGSTPPEDRFMTKGKFERFNSYTQIDNNYSPLDSVLYMGEKHKTFFTDGIAALKITAAHEFHHAIQYAYGVPKPEAPLLNEMTSTWMEYRLFPEIKDYQQFLPRLFSNLESFPFGLGSSEAGYSWSIFGQMIYSNFGDKVIKRMWENIADSIDGYAALDKAFKDNGSNMIDEWQKFLPWMYYTGSRSVQNKYFDDARQFPEIQPYNDSTFNVSEFSGSLSSFEIRAFRCTFQHRLGEDDETIDILVSNTDLETAKQQIDRKKDFKITISKNSILGSQKIRGSNYYLTLDAPQGDIIYSTFVNNGILNDEGTYAYPNPFMPNPDKALSIVLPIEAQLYQKVNLSIYNSEMTQIYSSDLAVITDNAQRIVRIEDNNFINDISSGIYIYSIKYNDKQITNKFAVIRR